MPKYGQTIPPFFCHQHFYDTWVGVNQKRRNMWAISNQLSYSQGGLKRWKVQQLFWTVQRSKFWRRKNNIIYYIHLSASKKGEFCISVCVYLYFYVFVFCSLVGVQGNFTWVTGKQTKFWDGLDNYWPRYLVTVQCHPLPRLELTFIFVFIFLFWDSG